MKKSILITILLTSVFLLSAKAKSSSAIRSKDKLVSVEIQEDGFHITKKHDSKFKHVTVCVEGPDGGNYSISTDEKTNSFIYPFVEKDVSYKIYITMMDANWSNWKKSDTLTLTAAGGLGEVRSEFGNFYYDNDSMSVVLEDYVFEAPSDIDLLGMNISGNVYYDYFNDKIDWSKIKWGQFSYDINSQKQQLKVNISNLSSVVLNTTFFTQLTSAFTYEGTTYKRELLYNNEFPFEDSHSVKEISLSSGLLVPPYNPGITDYIVRGSKEDVTVILNMLEESGLEAQKAVLPAGKGSSVSVTAGEGKNQIVYNFDFEVSPQFEFDGKTYTQTFFDDFNGTKLNKDNWRICIPQERQGSMKNHGWWMNEAVSLDGEGHLVITATSDGKTNISGGIESKDRFEQSHGYYEIKFKCENTSGLWYAFWLMGDNDKEHIGNGATDAAEIDVFELIPNEAYKGPNQFKSTIHWDAYGAEHKSKGSGDYKVSSDFYDDWHILQFVWGETSYKLWLDGEFLWEMDASKVDEEHFGGMCNGRNYMIISSEFGDWGGPLDLKKLPARMLVDYVKVGK